MRPRFPSTALVCFLAFCSSGFSQSLYSVSLDTSQVKGASGTLVFDITSNHPLTNRADLLQFATDGITGLPQTSGGLVTGDLIQHSNPARFTRMTASTFLTELAIPFIAFGERISFGVNVSETAAESARPPDEFSFYVLDANGDSLTDARGKPDFSITITGARGGLFELVHAVETPQRSRGVRQTVYTQGSRVPIAVTRAWTPDDPSLTQQAQVYTGILTEFCNRRCAGETICTGGAFGVEVNEDTFYSFDDAGNLKAQVALVDHGLNPQAEGQFGGVKVTGLVSNSVLTVLSIALAPK